MNSYKLRGKNDFIGGGGMNTMNYIYLCDRLRTKTKAKMTRPTELTETEEKLIAESLLIMGNSGYPLTSRDLRTVIKNFLDNDGRESKRFINNMPGLAFTRQFVKRYPELTIRNGNLIKRLRAALSTSEL